MLYKTKGIVLHHIKYSDSSIIAYIYTEVFGTQAYLINGIRSKNSKIKANLLQPLFLVDIITYHKSKRGLQRVKEIRNLSPFTSIPYNVVKSSIALFLAEILYKTLREEEPDQGLFEYLFTTIQLLDIEEKQMANFHLLFLIQLTKYLGFFPDDNYSETNKYFDLKEGNFVPSQPFHPHFLSPDLSIYYSQLINNSFNQLHSINMNYKLRGNLLEKIIEYYQLHLENIKEIKSYNVLKSVFE